MLKLFRALLAGERQSARRNPTGPWDLRAGDMLRLADSYALPDELRGETFKVQKVATYYYADEPTPQYVLRGGSGGPLFLTIEDEDGEEVLAFGRKLKRKEVEQLVGWDRLITSLRDTSDQTLPANAPTDGAGWTAQSYTKRVSGAKAAYYERDLRGVVPAPKGGETCTYHEYYSQDEAKLLEVEVWDGDEYEVCVGLIRPFSDIAEYWAAPA